MIKKSITFLLLSIIFIASSYSLFNGKMFRVHDYIHAARIVEMSDALSSGHFPVRWTRDFGYGFGMPLFEFYAPLPFYFGSFLYFLGLNINWSVKSLFLASNVFSLSGSYLLGKKLFGRKGGIITSAAFTLAPYRAVNLFVRGAISEAWGMMALPWILYYLVRLVKEKDNKNNFIGLIISLFVLALSHNLTTLMFFPLSFIFATAYLVYDQGFKKAVKKFAKIISAYLLSVGLASFYMIPALVEKSQTQIDSILSGYFHYSHHFLYIRQFFKENWLYGGSQWGPNDDMSFFLGYGQLLLFLLLGLFMIKDIIFTVKINSIKSTLLKIINKYYLILVTGLLLTLSLFMSLLKSKWLWDNLPLLSYIQFPWRWLAPAIIFLAIMAGFTASKLNNSKLIFLVIFIGLIFNAKYFQPNTYLENSKDFYYTDKVKIQRQMSDILPDYIPLQMETEEIRAISQQLEEDDLLLNPDLDYQILVNRTGQTLVGVDLAQDTILSFKTADYPGWRAEIDGEKVDYSQGELGNIEVEVSKGQHKVGLLLEKSNVRRIADLISLVSLGILIGFILDKKDKYKNSK